MRTLGRFCVLFALCSACGPSGRDGGDGTTDGGNGDSGGGGGGGDGNAEVTFVYAHTASTLYKVDPDTLAITMVASFAWSNGSDSMTDIAIDKTGLMLGVSGTSVYRIDPTTAAATRLSAGLTGQFNGLSFVPAATIGQSGDDVLVGTRNADGIVFKINPMTGQATQIGNMGGYSSSGDLVAVTNFGTVLTAEGGIAADRLVRLAPSSFAATAVGSDIGYSDIFGVAFWKNKIFGFTASGQFITIDPNTGVGTLVQSNGPAWWGAAVTTSAPVIL
ncbi:MAG: hypothetical protein H0T46_24095 [Deltaproteobacteria bacterium]|nr:hypothetical protein [Deltaproteobacteria bacterium]